MGLLFIGTETLIKVHWIKFRSSFLLVPFVFTRPSTPLVTVCYSPFLSQVCVRKVRNKVIGRIGDTFLKYDRYLTLLMNVVHYYELLCFLAFVAG